MHTGSLYMLHVCIRCSPDQWFEEDEDGSDEHGGMDNVKCLDVLLVPEKKKMNRDHEMFHVLI